MLLGLNKNGVGEFHRDFDEDDLLETALDIISKTGYFDALIHVRSTTGWAIIKCGEYVDRLEIVHEVCKDQIKDQCKD